MGKEEAEVKFDLEHMFNPTPALNKGAHKLCGSVTESIRTFPSTCANRISHNNSVTTFIIYNFFWEENFH